MKTSTNKADSLDRILGAEEELAPSSGFVSSVMDRVREEAVAPEPIPFPWRRALPGMIVAGGGLVWCAVKVVQMGVSAAGTVSFVPLLQPAILTSPQVKDAGWVAAALGVSLLSWLLARRLVGRGGLI